MNIRHVNWNGEISADNTRPLLLVFLGYSFTPDCIQHLECGSYDLSVVYDYKTLEVNLDFIQNRNVYVVAWSMGVWAASQFLAQGVEKFNATIQKAVAINGTPYGIDDRYGIPSQVFLKSIEQFDFEAFKKWCFLGDLPRAKDFSFNENSKVELETLYRTIVEQKTPFQEIRFDKVIVSKKDVVFPPAASDYYGESPIYEDSSPCTRVNLLAAHFPFFKFNSFDEIFE